MNGVSVSSLIDPGAPKYFASFYFSDSPPPLEPKSKNATIPPDIPIMIFETHFCFPSVPAFPLNFAHACTS